jgi:two-component system, sensor histidine kinase and response regulator
MKILNDILEFSKIAAGRMTLEAVPFDAGLADDVLRLLAAKATQKGIGLRLEVDGEPAPELLGDPLRLRQILVNLVDNVVEFTERGEVVLRVAAAAPRDRHIPLRLSVRDSGSGIPEAQRSLIFQHFTQADSSTTRNHGGTGLGLAICRQLVELMRDRIEGERPGPGQHLHGRSGSSDSRGGRGGLSLAARARGSSMTAVSPPQPPQPADLLALCGSFAS